jgi:hypothetical protein
MALLQLQESGLIFHIDIQNLVDGTAGCTSIPQLVRLAPQIQRHHASLLNG